MSRHTGNEHNRTLQKKLAEELTCFVHSRDEYEFALNASGILFSNDTSVILKQLNEEELLQVMEGVPAVTYSASTLVTGIDIVTFLSDTKIFPSKGEARKMIQGGGVSLNKEKIENAGFIVTNEVLLNGKYLLIQKGKKNYYLVEAS